MQLVVSDSRNLRLRDPQALGGRELTKFVVIEYSIDLRGEQMLRGGSLVFSANKIALHGARSS